MPVYTYTSVTPSGAAREGKIEAASDIQARALLQSRGRRFSRLRAAGGQEITARRPTGRSPSPDQVATTVRQLSILVRSGVPLVEGLYGLAEQATSQTLRRSLEEMASDVREGSALSVAFSRHPHVFPSLAAEMARVAEAGGDLAESTARLADYIEASAEIRRRIKSALAYPTVIMIISVITVLLMVTFILPRFTALFSKMGATVPWSTRMLIGLSNALTGQWYAFLLGGALAVHLFKTYARSQSGRRRMDSLALKLPLIGDVVTKVVLSRAIASLATLLGSGVPMVRALEISAAAANNLIVKEALLQASREVAEGNATSQSLKSCGLFPPLVLQMVASGEKTGELPSMLSYVCSLYDRETDAKVKTLTSVIEPIMIVLLGITVGFVALSVIVPIYSLVGGVK